MRVGYAVRHFHVYGGPWATVGACVRRDGGCRATRACSALQAVGSVGHRSELCSHLAGIGGRILGESRTPRTAGSRVTGATRWPRAAAHAAATAESAQEGRRLGRRNDHADVHHDGTAIRVSKALSRSNRTPKGTLALLRTRQRINRRLLFHVWISDCGGGSRRPKLQGTDQQRREVRFRGSVVGRPRRDFTPAPKPASTKRRLDGLLAARDQRTAHILRSLHRGPTPSRRPTEAGCSLRRLWPGSTI